MRIFRTLIKMKCSQHQCYHFYLCLSCNDTSDYVLWLTVYSADFYVLGSAGGRLHRLCDDGDTVYCTLFLESGLLGYFPPDKKQYIIQSIVINVSVCTIQRHYLQYIASGREDLAELNTGDKQNHELEKLSRRICVLLSVDKAFMVVHKETCAY